MSRIKRLEKRVESLENALKSTGIISLYKGSDYNGHRYVKHYANIEVSESIRMMREYLGVCIVQESCGKTIPAHLAKIPVAKKGKKK